MTPQGTQPGMPCRTTSNAVGVRKTAARSRCAAAAREGAARVVVQHERDAAALAAAAAGVPLPPPRFASEMDLLVDGEDAVEGLVSGLEEELDHLHEIPVPGSHMERQRTLLCRYLRVRATRN